MLILSRKENQQIIIGEGDNEILITVLICNRGQVKLGVDAPKNIPVDRVELRDRKILYPRGGNQ